MWVMVFFDLPVLTKRQQRAANHYRNFLIKSGFERVQLSVYSRFCPTIQRAKSAGKRAVAELPPEGACRILYLTDHQWHRMVSIQHQKQVDMEQEPEQLVIFGDSSTPETPAISGVPGTSEA